MSFTAFKFARVLKLSDVRPYCYQILVAFVIVHAEVCEVSIMLVRRVIRELLCYLAQDMLACFRKVDGLSLNGMLQVSNYNMYRTSERS